VKHLGLAVLAAGAALLAPTGAFASVESFTHTITNVTSEEDFALPEYFSLRAFDLALGTLQSVKLTLTVGTISTVVFFTENPGSGYTYPDAAVGVGLDPTVYGPGALVSVSLEKLFVTPVTFSDAGDGPVSGLSIDASTNSAYAYSSHFGEYTGSAPVDFEFVLGAVNYIDYTGDSNIFVGAPDSSTTANGSFTVSYIYASVPEPSTWAMMLTGFGLVAGAAFARRRAARAA